MKTVAFVFLLTPLFAAIFCSSIEKESQENSSGEEADPKQREYYKFLIRRLKQNANAQRSASTNVLAAPYAIPGPFEPLPGRSHNGNYWPLFPFANQYSGGLDLDPALSRDNIVTIYNPVWGMMDIKGHFFNRISDTTTKIGYVSQPVNMLGLDKRDFARIISDPSLNHNRYIHPTLPLGKVPKSYVPVSCKVEHDIGGSDGVNGDIDVPIPISKGVAYRYPIGGNIYYDLDNITISYGHNVGPLDPYTNPYMFGNMGYIRNTQKILEDFYARTNPPTSPRRYPPRQTRSVSNTETIPESYSRRITPLDYRYPIAEKRSKGQQVLIEKVHAPDLEIQHPFREEISSSRLRLHNKKPVFPDIEYFNRVDYPSTILWPISNRMVVPGTYFFLGVPNGLIHQGLIPEVMIQRSYPVRTIDYLHAY